MNESTHIAAGESRLQLQISALLVFFSLLSSLGVSEQGAMLAMGAGRFASANGGPATGALVLQTGATVPATRGPGEARAPQAELAGGRDFVSPAAPTDNRGGALPPGFTLLPDPANAGGLGFVPPGETGAPLGSGTTPGLAGTTGTSPSGLGAIPPGGTGLTGGGPAGLTNPTGGGNGAPGGAGGSGITGGAGGTAGNPPANNADTGAPANPPPGNGDAAPPPGNGNVAPPADDGNVPPGPVPVVPEPATWLMMILGVAIIGGSLRARRARPVEPVLAEAGAR